MGVDVEKNHWKEEVAWGHGELRQRELMEEEEPGASSSPGVRGDFCLPWVGWPPVPTPLCSLLFQYLWVTPYPGQPSPASSVSFTEDLDKESLKGWRQEVDEPYQNLDPDVRT